jgi:LDH2 family malate/lactate/ureidoglycolate dehydrogenase
VDALVSQEDSRYFGHDGVDYQGILRAVWLNFQAGRETQGASTITQQLARNTFQLTEKSYKRKLLEALTAMRIDAFRDLDEYYTGIDTWIRRFNATTPIDTAEPVLIHGELEQREYRLRKKNGIPINPKVVADMEALAEKFKITL